MSSDDPPAEVSTPRSLGPHTAWWPGRAEVWFDRRALAMAVRTLRGARESIDLEVFILGGRLGIAILRELDRKARAGVPVRLLHREGATIRAGAWLKRRFRRWTTGPGTHHYEPVVDRIFRTRMADSPIRRAGFPLHRFGARFAPLKLAHDKLIVVDRRVAIVGGMNLATAVAGNHDLLLRVTGPAVRSAAALFEYDWRLANGEHPALPEAQYEPVAGATDSAWPHRLRLVVTRPDLANQREAVNRLIGDARRRVWVQMFYVTDCGVVEALARAAARGVDVRVLCDPNEFSLGVHLYGAPNLPFVVQLARSGVSVRLFCARPGAQMHQKSMVVDSRVVFTGATNFTRQSFRVNTESAFIVEGDDVAGLFETRFLEDWNGRSARPDESLIARRRLYVSVVRLVSRYV